MKKLCLLLTVLMITACTNGFRDPLLDTPLGDRTVCTSVKPLEGNDQLSTVPFNCPDLDVSATLNELRDAGWRLEKVNIGSEVYLNDKLASDVEITVRKIY